jgi:hypothetical protein
VYITSVSMALNLLLVLIDLKTCFIIFAMLDGLFKGEMRSVGNMTLALKETWPLPLLKGNCPSLCPYETDESGYMDLMTALASS